MATDRGAQPFVYSSMNRSFTPVYPRQSARRVSNFVKHSPLYYGILYLGSSVLLYFAGPIAYPNVNSLGLAFYLTAAFAVMCIGYSVAIRYPPIPSRRPHAGRTIVIGALLGVVMLFPTSWAYTGSMPWEVLTAIRDQKAAYLAMQDQLEATTDSRQIVILLRMLTQPFTFAAVPLGIIYWRTLNTPIKVCVLGAAMTSLVFSALRGTDREVADLGIVVLSSIMVSRARLSILNGPKPAPSAKKIALIVLGCLFVLGAYTAFSNRKAERMGTINEFCLGASGVCANYQSPLVRLLSPQDKFSIAQASAYFTNGYYGLSLALTKPLESTFGLGHSPALMRLYQLLTGDQNIAFRTFNYRGIDDGWPDLFFWSSMPTSLANDVGFLGALALLAIFGAVWARSWAHASYGANDAAAVVFVLSMQTIFYFPANLQVLMTLDGYSTVVFWVVAWHLTANGKRLALRGRCPS